MTFKVLSKEKLRVWEHFRFIIAKLIVTCSFFVYQWRIVLKLFRLI